MSNQMCEFSQCNRPVRKKGLCESHYAQRYVYKIALKPIRGTTDAITYAAAHRRLYRRYGKASQYACDSCLSGGLLVDADEWSYNGASKQEMVEVRYGMPMAYSPSPVDYRPVCRSCHRTANPRKSKAPLNAGVGGEHG